MATLYLRSSDGDNSSDGLTWANAKATLAGIDSIDAAGDTIYVSQAHSESSAAALTFNFAGTAINPTKLICANDSAEPPTATASSAIVATSGANNLRINGSVYGQGMIFNCGSAASNFASLTLNAAAGGVSCSQFYENCEFNLIDQHPSSILQIGSASGGDASRIRLVNCKLKLGNSNQSINLYGSVQIKGGSFNSGTATPSPSLFGLAGSGKDSQTVIENFDFSNLSAAVSLVKAPASTSSPCGTILLRNIKLPASWTGSLVGGSFTNTAFRAEMYNAISGSTVYAMWIEDAYGSIKSENTILKTGGASDGTTARSWKMTSNANANEYSGSLGSQQIRVWNDTTGASKTVSVDILHDSVTGLTDSEVWLEVEELGTTGSTLGITVSSKRATVLTTAAAHTTSSATWTTTGLTNPNKQTLSVTFTPQSKGLFLVKVLLAKASKVLYVDPLVMVA